MKLTEIIHFLANTAEQAAINAVLLSESHSELQTRADAYRQYGRTNVDRWVSEGLIRPGFQPGKTSKKLFIRTELERVAATSNRMTYLPVTER